MDALKNYLRSRIAPTPSGFLHEGNLVDFLIQKELSLKHDAELGLRIDDLDRERFRPEHLSDIFRCLHALDIHPAFGPRNEEEFYAGYRQELRLKRYQEVLEMLRLKDLLYVCTCSRKDLEKTGHHGCPNDCGNMSLPFGLPDSIWRLRWPGDVTVSWSDGFLGHVVVGVSDRMGNVVLRRRDGLPAYQITSLVDDFDLNIGMIVRGKDLLESTAVQIWLSSQLWGEKEIIRYHHPLLTGPSGEKLSKSAGASAHPLELDSGKINELKRTALVLMQQSAKKEF